MLCKTYLLEYGGLRYFRQAKRKCCNFFLCILIFIKIYFRGIYMSTRLLIFTYKSPVFFLFWVSHDLSRTKGRQEKSITYGDVVHRDIEALDDNVSQIKLLKELTDSRNKFIQVSKFLLSLIKFIMRTPKVNAARSLQYYYWIIIKVNKHVKCIIY